MFSKVHCTLWLVLCALYFDTPIKVQIYKVQSTKHEVQSPDDLAPQRTSVFAKVTEYAKKCDLYQPG